MSQEINLPEIVAEVSAAFQRYELALNENDVAVLDELFWDDPLTLRYGVAENLYGYAAIAAFRAGRDASGVQRRIFNTVITTYGRDGGAKLGRQSQTWMRTADGWRVVAAHVSLL